MKNTAKHAQAITIVSALQWIQSSEAQNFWLMVNKWNVVCLVSSVIWYIEVKR